MLANGLEGAALLGTRAAAGLILTLAKLPMYNGLIVLNWDLLVPGLLMGTCSVPEVGLSPGGGM